MTHKSADTRIREAFDALRAEMVSLFGEPKEPADCDDPNWPLWHSVATIDAAQEIAHDFAKLPEGA
jgi:hypothetical protein